MLSMGVPSSVRRCKKWGRIYPASPSHRLPAAEVFVIFFVVGIGGVGGKKRWRLRRRRTGIAYRSALAMAAII
jgi:hypothetical protein